ncbi:MAG: hypothetical protein AB7K52_00905 [Phycisphaerales bacterium]
MAGPGFLFNVLAGALGLVGLALLLWSLFSDRPRGRRRCPRCWYDMAGAAGLICPECGHDARHERRLHTTRRRRRWVVVSVLLLALASACVLTPRVMREGWGVLPVRAVLGLESLVGRDTIESLSAHRRQLIWAWQPPAWSDSEVAAVFERALRDSGCVRERWPAGKKLSVSTIHDGRIGRFTWFCTPVDWTEETAFATSVDQFATHQRFAPRLWHALDGSEHATSITFEVRTARGPLRRVRFPVSIERVPTVDDAIAPVRAPALDAAVEASLSPRMVVYPESGRVGVSVMPPLMAPGAPAPPIAVGLVITFERDGREMARALVLTRVGEVTSSMTLPSELTGDVQAVLDAAAGDPAWTVRIRGDGELSLRDFAAERYWAGEFVLPLSDVKK